MNFHDNITPTIIWKVPDYFSDELILPARLAYEVPKGRELRQGQLPGIAETNTSSNGTKMEKRYNLPSSTVGTYCHERVHLANHPDTKQRASTGGELEKAVTLATRIDSPLLLQLVAKVHHKRDASDCSKSHLWKARISMSHTPMLKRITHGFYFWILYQKLSTLMFFPRILDILKL